MLQRLIEVEIEDAAQLQQLSQELADIQQQKEQLQTELTSDQTVDPEAEFEQTSGELTQDDQSVEPLPESDESGVSEQVMQDIQAMLPDNEQNATATDNVDDALSTDASDVLDTDTQMDQSANNQLDINSTNLSDEQLANELAALAADTTAVEQVASDEANMGVESETGGELIDVEQDNDVADDSATALQQPATQEQGADPINADTANSASMVDKALAWWNQSLLNQIIVALAAMIVLLLIFLGLKKKANKQEELELDEQSALLTEEVEEILQLN